MEGVFEYQIQESALLASRRIRGNQRKPKRENATEKMKLPGRGRGNRFARRGARGRGRGGLGVCEGWREGEV